MNYLALEEALVAGLIKAFFAISFGLFVTKVFVVMSPKAARLGANMLAFPLRTLETFS